MIEQKIKNQLVSDGVLTDAETFLGTLPATPDNAVAIGPAESVLNNIENTIASKLSIPAGIEDTKQTVCIVVRNTNYSDSSAKIQSIYNNLGGSKGGFKSCDGKQMFFIPVEPPYFFKEENGKSVFAFKTLVIAPA